MVLRHRWSWLLLCGLLAADAYAQAVGSTLSIASPLDQAAVYQDLQIAADNSGRAMIVYKGRDAEDRIVPFSVVRTGNTWDCDPIPMPDASRFGPTCALRSVVADTSGSFHLIASHSARLYYWRWSDGSWSTPDPLPDIEGTTASYSLTTDSQGEPLIATASTRFRCIQKRGVEWQITSLPFEITQRLLPAVMRDDNGALHLLGTQRGVPIVLDLAAGADPLVAADWSARPTGDSAEWTSVLPIVGGELCLVLDWPRQRTVAAWSEPQSGLHVGWAPLGTTSGNAWQTTTIDVPPGGGHRGHCLAANATGAVGLLALASPKGVHSLLFRWIGPDAPGEPIPLLRPGTDTEAAAFSTISGENMAVAIDPQGVAHVAIVAEKRGEVPAGTRRVFYATVTGGGTVGSGPQVEGHGTTEMEREGAPPDFAVRIIVPDGGLAEQRRSSYSFARHGPIQPRIEVTNQGAEFYGDLTLEAVIDGAVVRVRYADETGHMKPLMERGQKHDFYLPSVVYEPDEASGVTPEAITYDEGHRPNRTLRLSTGLGRKTLAVIVDPDDAIKEEDEGNNTAEVDYIVSDGRNPADRERVTSNDQVMGLNDLCIMQTPRLRSNTQLIRAGYVQRPTQLDVLVGNPRLAGIFPSVDVEVWLDDTLLGRQTVGPLTKRPNLVERLLGTAVFYEPKPPKPDISGALVQTPVDLTTVAEGNHRLRIVVDPDDRYGDRVLDNNTAELDFRVRPPGGSLRVRVIDKTGDRGPIERATVCLQDLWAGWTDAEGWVTIPDVPSGAYDRSALTAERLQDNPPFYPAAAAPFHVVSGEQQSIIIELEKPLSVVGEVRASGTGGLLTGESVEAFIADEELYIGGSCQDGQYRIPNVPPGRHRLVVGAYGYQTAELVVDVARHDQTDEFRADVTLTDGPRGRITGRVVDQSNHGVADAMVWLTGAPRGTLTDAQGSYTLDRIASGTAYTVNAQAEDYTLASVELAPLAAGEVRPIEPLQITKVNREFKSIDFEATTYALCEATAGTGAMPTIQVGTSFGEFSGALGLSYHRPAGQARVQVDEVFVWLEGGTFIQGGVSSEIGIGDLIGVDLDTVAVGPMGTLINGYGYVVKGIEGMNKLAEWYYGSQDPSMLNRSNRVTATYMSHTGTEQAQEPLIEVPTSADVPVAMTFAGGGTTVVRVDFIEVRDSTAPPKVVRAEWYSPGFCVFHIGQEFDLATLEVELRIAVLNERLQSGVLGNSSHNRMLWRPSQERWLRLEGYNYEVWDD